MKKILIIVLFYNLSNFAQVYENSWYLGIGGLYPRYISITKNLISDNNNYGIYLNLGYKISKHSDIRIKSKYQALTSFYYLNSKEIKNKVDLLSLDFDVTYSPFPCDYLSPYFFGGFGLEVFNSSKPFSPELDNTRYGYQMSFGLGAEVKISEKFFLESEFAHITSSSNKVDGDFSVNEYKGLFDSNGDTFFTFGIGLKFYFNRDKKNNFCDIKTGLRDFDKPIKIGEIKIDTVYIEKGYNLDEFKFYGTNFDFNKSTLRYESYPILDNVAEILNKYPEIKLEIHGHTDSYGSNDYNLRLSLKRAEAVRNYLVHRGINSSRLIPIGLGESFPINSNLTPEERARNRRIEFRVIK